MTERTQRVTIEHSPSRCPFCHGPIDIDAEAWLVCGACLARHHDACWRESGSCATCGRIMPLGKIEPTASSKPVVTSQRPDGVQLTPVARAKALEFLRRWGGEQPALRLSISSEGRLGLEVDRERDDDYVDTIGDVRVVYSRPLKPALERLVIDFVDAGGAPGFSFGGAAAALDVARAKDALRSVRSVEALRARPTPWQAPVGCFSLLVGIAGAALIERSQPLGFVLIIGATILGGICIAASARQEP